MIYVTTKKELQEAIKRKEPEIIVTGKLAKKLKGFAKLKKLSKAQIAALVGLATSSGAIAVAALATAAPTGGLSVSVASFALMAAAPAAGVSSGTVLLLIAIIGVIGLAVIALLKDYDFECRAGDILYFKAKKSESK